MPFHLKVTIVRDFSRPFESSKTATCFHVGTCCNCNCGAITSGADNMIKGLENPAVNLLNLPTCSKSSEQIHF